MLPIRAPSTLESSMFLLPLSAVFAATIASRLRN